MGKRLTFTCKPKTPRAAKVAWNHAVCDRPQWMGDSTKREIAAIIERGRA